MKQFFILLIFLHCTFLANGQNFNCNLVFWDAIQDTVNLQDQPAVEIKLSTTENDLNTGYTTFMILNNEGDTIVDYSNIPSFWMPATLGDVNVQYILNIKPPFTTIGENFNGKLVTNFPECEFELTTNAISNPETNAGALTIQPNPFTDQFTIQNKSNRSGLLEIVDPKGQIVFQIYYSGQFNLIDASRWVPGIYYVRFKNTISKIIKH